jgi:hypothetical protein
MLSLRMPRARQNAAMARGSRSIGNSLAFMRRVSRSAAALINPGGEEGHDGRYALAGRGGGRGRRGVGAAARLYHENRVSPASSAELPRARARGLRPSVRALPAPPPRAARGEPHHSRRRSAQPCRGAVSARKQPHRGRGTRRRAVVARVAASAGASEPAARVRGLDQQSYTRTDGRRPRRRRRRTYRLWAR